MGRFFLRKYISLLLVLGCFVFFTACQRTVETSADELTSKVWVCENQNGIVAQLSFDGSFARFSVSGAEEGEIYEIYGRYAVDSEKFYISSDELYSTYEFTYKVFKDRLMVGYKENTLEFLAVSSL